MELSNLTNSMKYYIFRLRYSQTDSEVIIVQSHSEEGARARIVKSSARYVDLLGVSDTLL